MTTVPQYFAIVDDSTKWALEDASIAALLLEKGGITLADVQGIRLLLPKGQHAWAGAQAAGGPKVQATQLLQAGVEGVKFEMSDLRNMMHNNLPPRDPLFTQLGLVDKAPGKQDEILAYAVRTFTNGKNLTEAEIAPLAKHKWDLARFSSALTRAEAAQAANDQQEGAKANAKAATDAVYNQIDQIDVLFRPFAKDARRVLEKVPGALDKMQLAKGVPAKPLRPSAYTRKAKSTPGNKGQREGQSE